MEIVVAEVGQTAADDEIYRITFEGSVADEHDFVVVGGQADKVAAVLKEQLLAVHVADRGDGPGDRRRWLDRGTATPSQSPPTSWKWRCWSAAGRTGRSAA